MFAGRRQAVGMLGAMLCGAALPAPADGRTYRLGVLSFQYPKDKNLVLPALARLGYVEGRNVVYEYRYCESDLNQLDAKAAELVALQVDLIIATMSPEVQAVLKHTRTIPVAMTYTLAPVEMGLIRSFAHPGGNVTGTAWWAPATASKIGSLLHELVPRARRIADLGISGVPGAEYYIEARRRAARMHGIDLVLMNISSETELQAAFARIRKENFEGIVSSDLGILETLRPAILEFAQKHRLVTAAPRKAAITAGFVMGFFPEASELTTRTAIIIDRVLRGESPSKIPVEQPMRVATIINLKAAKAIGMTVPQAILLQATEIIQ